ncbi:MAG: histidinol-phosphate transaminase [Clostridia bacterium]|nr:histidinol-phosphate transaminase [Clostridia bacterium]
MSKFFSNKFSGLAPYVPGEQPRGAEYIKLNTNESPFPPSSGAVAAGAKALERLMLYPDPECGALCAAAAETFGVRPEQVICTNGSDEVLSWAFAAFCDGDRPAVFPDVTYGFYPVFAREQGVPYREVPLKDDLTVDIDAFMEAKGTLVIANPNAPTGIALPRDVIEALLRADPARMVVVDEAYVDFGGESVVKLIERYDNLLVTQTFSKSRSMAGARLGLGFAAEPVIRDLNTLRFSVNPYNVNSVTLAAGIGALADPAYTAANCRTVIENRAFAAAELIKLGFELTDSRANIVFARYPGADGETLYRELKAKGILVRHFAQPERISDYLRITVGTRAQMEALLRALAEIINA